MKNNEKCATHENENSLIYKTKIFFTLYHYFSISRNGKTNSSEIIKLRVSQVFIKLYKKERKFYILVSNRYYEF